MNHKTPMSTRVAGEIVGAVSGVFALACAYDLSGNRTSLVAVAAGGAATNTTTYLYGSGNRLLSDASDATTVQTYAYSAFGSIRHQTGPDPNRVTYTGIRVCPLFRGCCSWDAIGSRGFMLQVPV